MSKYNNVNPGQYKTAGRLRMGEQTNQAADRQALSKSRQSSRTTSKPRAAAARTASRGGNKRAVKG
jgi:hypothetical protein